MPAKGYWLTPDAQSDLVDVRRFTLREWGQAQSQKYFSELRQPLGLLADNPSLGKARPELGEKLASFPHGSHIIYYLMHKRQLIVIGVLHKRMVPLNHLTDRTHI